MNYFTGFTSTITFALTNWCVYRKNQTLRKEENPFVFK
jgi:hypothetical protein